MHALGQHFDGQRAGGDPAQRRRRPQALVVAAAGIEADDEIDAAQARRQMLEIGRQVVAARFLAGFDHPRAARVRKIPAPAARRSRRARRTRRSRRRRCRARRACRPRSAESTDRTVECQPVISGCLSRWPYSTHGRDRRALPATPARRNSSSGVRPLSRDDLDLEPAHRSACAPTLPPAR